MKDDEAYHHSIEQDHEENIWVCVYYHPYKIDKKYINEKTDAIIDESVFGVYLMMDQKKYLKTVKFFLKSLFQRFLSKMGWNIYCFRWNMPIRPNSFK